MRENYKKSIASMKKFPQFTTMNVIDGQAGLIICASLIFYSLTIDNILNIIVLLILAGVSIATLTGQNGILTQASKAKEENRAASVQEVIDLWKTNKKSDELARTRTAEKRAELIDKLKAQGLITNKEYSTLLVQEKVTIGTREIVIEFPKTLVQAFNDGDLEVGDYVNYTPVAGTTTSVVKAETGYDETQTYTVQENNTNWQVLGLSEDGNNLLLTSIVAKDGEDPYLIMKGAECYIMGERTLNKICSIYKNDYADEARSIKVEDINRVLGITVDEETNTIYKTTGETTIIISEGSESLDGDEFEYQENDYVPENYVIDMYLTDENVDEEIKTYIQNNVQAGSIGEKVKGNMYGYETTSSNVVEQGGAIYNMLFAGTTNAHSYAKGYWLASNGRLVSVASDGGMVAYGLGMVAGMDGNNILFSAFMNFINMNRMATLAVASKLGVRPVITLNSEVTLEDIQEITLEELNTEATWTQAQLMEESSGILSGEEGKLVQTTE